MSNRLLALTSLAAATVIGILTTAFAQDNYPSRPIRLITPEVVGSAADVLSRIIAEAIGKALSQPVTIENLYLEAGVEKGIKSPPDGYTLIYGSSGNLALLPHVKKVAFDPLTDLTPVARFAIQPTLIAVSPSLPVTTLQELVALMKAKPGALRMSTAGAGTAGHFAGERFIAMTGVKPVVVHHNGGGPAIEAVVNNDSQWTVAPIAGRLSLMCAPENSARSQSAAPRGCRCCRRFPRSRKPAIPVSEMSGGAPFLCPTALRRG